MDKGLSSSLTGKLLHTSCRRFRKLRLRINGRALVETGKAIELALGGRSIDAFTQDGHVKTRALHLHKLVNQHVTCGTQFTFKTKPAAQ